MAAVRFAVIQLTCHPYLTIGGRDYSSEPFLDDNELILSRLSTSMDISSAREVCRQHYDTFQAWRVASSLEWIKKQWSLDRDETDKVTPEHVVVFPEGSLSPTQITQIVVPFVEAANGRGKRVTVLAGTHSFKGGDIDIAQYPSTINEYLTNTFLPKGKVPPEVLGDVIARCDLSESTDSFGEWIASIRAQAIAESMTASELGRLALADVEEDAPMRQHENSLKTLVDEERLRRKSLDRSELRLLELRRIALKEGHDAKSVLPIVHYDGSVTLRTKEAPSPFERTNISLFGAPRLESPTSSFIDKDQQTALLPLVCSEALQSSGDMDDADIVAVVAYHERPREFRARLDTAKMNGKLVVLANDGRYGGSGVFLINDRRAENWWFGAPRNGMLDTGDGILLVDVDTKYISPETGRYNPKYPSGIKKLAALIPGNVGAKAKRVHEQTRKILQRIHSLPSGVDTEFPKGVDYASLLHLVQPLVDSSAATAIQKTKLWRLRELIQLRNLSPERVQVWCEDCELENVKFFTPSYGGSELERPVALDLTHLQGKLAWEVLQHLEHETSIANERGMSHNADELVSVKRQLESRVGQVSASAPLTNLFREMERCRANAQATARQRLVRRVGRLVERFRATSGWLFSVQHNETIDGDSTDFYPVAAYNAPELEIYRSVGDPDMGIVGRVIETGRPYLAKDVHSEPHKEYYQEDVPSTKSELTVPIREGDVIVGVLNLEANYCDAFTPVDLLSLEAEARRLATDLIVLSTANAKQESAVWHPSCDGWQLRTYLDRFCNAIASSLPTIHGSPSIGASVWALDPSKGLLSVIGTARFDFEYISETHLAVHDSHVGKAIVAYCKDRNIKLDLPQDSHDHSGLSTSNFEEHNLISDQHVFKRKMKATRMELRSIAVFPFEVPKSEDSDTTVVCALAIYGFQHDWGVRGISLAQMFNQTVGRTLASELGNVISQFHENKKRLARAYLIGRLSGDATAARSPFETVKQVFQRVMGAHGCTMFYKSLNLSSPDLTHSVGQLALAATTGVTPAGESHPTVRHAYPLYPLDDSNGGCKRKLPVDFESISYYEGLTNFLGQKDGGVLRKNDVVDILEPVNFGASSSPEIVHLAPRNTLLESFAPGASEHMRFIGASVTEEGRNVGVIRLTRTGNAPPFLPIDETVLSALCESCSNVFAAEQQKAAVNFNELPLTSTVAMEPSNHYASLGRKISTKYGTTYHDSIARSALNFVAFLSMIADGPDDEMKLDLTKAAYAAAKEMSGDNSTVPDSSWDEFDRLISVTISELQRWETNADTRNYHGVLRQMLLHPAQFVGPQVAISAVLEDLNEGIFRGLKAQFASSLETGNDTSNNPIALSSLRCVLTDSDRKVHFLHTVCVQPSWNSNRPDEDRGEGLPRPLHEDANGWMAVKKWQPLSYTLAGDPPPNPERFHVMHGLSESVRAGVCLPFIAELPTRLDGWAAESSDDTKLQMVLSVDFAKKEQPEVLEALVFPLLKLTSQKIQALLSGRLGVNNMREIQQRYQMWQEDSIRQDESTAPEENNGIVVNWWK